MIAYRLTFDGALRVPGAGALFPRSDTLHAALCTAMAALGEDAGAVALDPPFALSSLFPWVRRRATRAEAVSPQADATAAPAISPAATELAPASTAASGPRRPGDFMYFAPAPLGVALTSIAPHGDSATPAVAPLTAPRYLSLALLSRLFGAESPGPSRAPATADGAPLGTGVSAPVSVASQGGALWSDAPIGARLWVEESPARRALDRGTRRPRGSAHVGSAVRFVPDAGLFFLAQPRDAAGRRLLEAGLAWLGEEGFGRSAPFTVTCDEGFAPPRTGTGATMLLSLYWPTEAEVRGGVLVGGRYGLVARAGVHASGAERAVVNMVTEGAIVRGQPVGDTVCVAAPGALRGVPHAVHRCGRALGLPVSAEALR